MIRSRQYATTLLRGGWYITRGSFSGYWLRKWTNGRRQDKRILPSLVRELQDDDAIVRSDDKTTRAGETWTTA